MVRLMFEGQPHLFKSPEILKLSVFCLVATVKIYSHAIIPLGSIRKTSSNIPPLSIQLEEINLISWDTLASFGLVYLLYIGVMNFVFVEPCDKVNQNNSPSRNNCYSLKCSLLLLFSEIRLYQEFNTNN